MMVLSMVLSGIAVSFGYRFRGGLLEQWIGRFGGTQANRAAGALVVALVVFFLSQFNWYYTAGSFVLAFIGFVWTNFMPKSQGGMLPRTLYQVLGTSYYSGLKGTAPLMLGAFAAGLPWFWLLPVALLHGPMYYIAQLWQPHAPKLGLNPDKLPDPPALAEYYIGFLLGVALVPVMQSVVPGILAGLMLPQPLWQYDFNPLLDRLFY